MTTEVIPEDTGAEQGLDTLVGVTVCDSCLKDQCLFMFYGR